MLASLRAELLKLRHRPAVWVLAAAWWALALVFGYVFPYLAYRFQTGPRASLGAAALPRALPAELVPTAVQGFPLFAGALALLLGVLVAGSEYSWTTVKVIFTQGPSRSAVVTGKLSALLLVLAAIVVASFGLDALASVLVAATTHSAVSWPGVATILRGLGGGWLIVAMWGIGGAMLGTVLRGTSLAAGIGLVWTLAVENLLRVFASIVPGLDSVEKFLPGTNAGALAAALGSATQNQAGGVPGVTAVVGGLQSMSVTLAYVAAFVVLAVFVTRRRDLA